MSNFEPGIELDSMRPENSDDFEEDYDETAFDNLPEIEFDEVRSHENRQAVLDFYEEVKNQRYKIDRDALLKNKALFEVDDEGERDIVYVKYKDKRIRLTPQRGDDKFLKLRSIARNYGAGGTDFIRNVLGVTDYSPGGAHPKLSPQVEDAAINVSRTTPAALENIELQDLSGTVDRVSESVENLATRMRDAEVGTDLELQQNARDLERAHKFIDTLSGQIKASAAKISALEEGIVKLEDEKESEDITPDEVAEIDEKIKELTEQRDLQRNHLNRDLLPGLKSQFARIRETVNTVLYSDRTLGEKIRTLFREQGITIVSVLTALGFAIATITEGIALGVKNATPNPKPKPPGPDPDPSPEPGPKPPKPTPGSREWIKQMLQKIANLLIKLGDKALAALPGIIGAVVNFLLKSAATAVGFLTENLWAFIVAVGGLLYVYLGQVLKD